jgi:hypothetical protein
MDNIIQFPNKREDLHANPANLEDVEDKVLNLKHYHISETLSAIIPNLFALMNSSGFLLEDLEDEDAFIKDGAFLVESVRSIMCKHYGIPHPFQKIAQKVFIATKDGDETKFEVVDKLNIKFKQDK